MNDQALAKIRSLFDDNNITYQLIHHAPCRTSAESAATRTAAGFPNAIGAKALLVKMTRSDQEELNVLVLPGTAKLDSKSLKQQIPDLRKFRFASAEEMQASCGVVPGCMPPFAKSVFPVVSHLFVDESLLQYEWLGFNAASLEDSIVVKAQDYLRIASPTSVLHFATT
jgi:prolyl-tRNA editing enzyme YbaK/EbsC (Cys-tRNA(Pro) deacylase)